MTLYPVNFLRRMSDKDRKALGKAGMLPEEACAVADARSERELQKNIAQLLGTHGIFYVRARMDKKTTTKKGVPDFLFAVQRRYTTLTVDGRTEITSTPCAWEIKHGDGKLSDAQKDVREQLLKNGWEYAVIRTFADAVRNLTALENR